MKYLRIAGRILTGGIIATLVWNLGIRFIFGPAQYFLANPEYQSRKFIAVFTEVEPLPRMFIQPMEYYIGFLIVGTAFSSAFYLMREWIPGNTFKKGIKFGLVAWLLTITWFEFYLPWNVMHEPLVLVVLELFLWIIVQMLVALSLAYTHYFWETRNS